MFESCRAHGSTKPLSRAQNSRNTDAFVLRTLEQEAWVLRMMEFPRLGPAVYLAVRKTLEHEARPRKLPRYASAARTRSAEGAALIRS